jgi:hypothetical protein
MEVQYHFPRIAVADPVGLDTTCKRYRLWSKAFVFSKLQVHISSRWIKVAVLGERLAAKLFSQHGEHDILEIGVGAILACERGSAQSGRRCEHWTWWSAIRPRQDVSDGLAFSVTEASPSLLGVCCSAIMQ